MDAYIQKVIDQLHLVGDGERSFGEVAQEPAMMSVKRYHGEMERVVHSRTEISRYSLRTLRLHLVQEFLKVKLGRLSIITP